MTRKSTLRSGIVAGLMTLAMLLSAAPAFAAGGPPAGRGGGGGHGGGQGGRPTAEATNNLSVPAILIGAGAPVTNCGAAVNPSGTPLSGYPINPANYYYVQGIHKWQASCATATAATVDAAWGANLIGEASLRTNSPIRVEMGLLVPSADTTALNMTGWVVEKLDPNALDRESAYGTQANGSPTTGFTSNPVTPYKDTTSPNGEVRVWVEGAALTLTNPDGTTSTLNATAEINATGRIVYGYNLRVTTAGTYTLHFTVPSSITVSTANGTSTVTKNADGSTTISLPITVAASAGGGGGGGGGRP